jgi:hypothetical protein
MELDLQRLFGLHVTLCTKLYSLAETPQPPPIPRIWTRKYEGAIDQPRHTTSLYDPLAGMLQIRDVLYKIPNKRECAPPPPPNPLAAGREQGKDC